MRAMSMDPLVRAALPFALTGALLGGCGGSSSNGSSSGSSSSSSALAADAKSAATGDIPDNQNFLTYSAKSVGFSIKYPEGWSQKKAAGGRSVPGKNHRGMAEDRSGQAPAG